MSLQNNKNLLSALLVKRAMDTHGLATGASNGIVVDRRGYGAAALILEPVDLGSGNFTVKVQHGDASNGSDMADFANNAPEPTASITTTASAVVLGLSLEGAKRYIRVVITAAGVTGTTMDVSASFVLGDPEIQVRTTDHDDHRGFYIPYE